MQATTNSVSALRAAQYVRMSTDHQQYSPRNQSEAIRRYAERHGMDIVRTYADEGKSGLSIDGRAALQLLIADIEAGGVDFIAILVYDVSRWGRFQDADESAYYEYICKRAGIQVIYCAEQFENDGSPVSTIVKGVKRAMAGEYSRELSAKVFAGQCHLIEKGYRQGGSAGYGLRRVLIDNQGQIKATLAAGEQKFLQTDRVILMPGPEEEIGHVRRIYQWFIDEALSLQRIADRLNDMEVKNCVGRQWCRESVWGVLRNEKYIGNNIYNRFSAKLKKPRVANPPSMWLRREGAFEGVITPETFYKAQEVFETRARRMTNSEIIERLRKIFVTTGTISGGLIAKDPELLRVSAIATRFGGLLKAYELAGYTPNRNYEHIALNKRLRQLQQKIAHRAEQQIVIDGGYAHRDPVTGLLNIADEITVSFVLSRCQTLPSGSLVWRVAFDPRLAPDLTVVVRMEVGNEVVRDYYLLPHLIFGYAPLNLREDNSAELACFQFAALTSLYGLARRADIRSGLYGAENLETHYSLEAEAM